MELKVNNTNDILENNLQHQIEPTVIFENLDVSDSTRKDTSPILISLLDMQKDQNLIVPFC